MDSIQWAVDSGQRAAGSQQWAGNGQWTLSSGQWAEVESVRHRTSVSRNFDFAKFNVFYDISISRYFAQFQPNFAKYEI